MALGAHTLAGVFRLGSTSIMILLRAARAGKSGKEHSFPGTWGKGGVPTGLDLISCLCSCYVVNVILVHGMSWADDNAMNVQQDH